MDKEELNFRLKILLIIFIIIPLILAVRIFYLVSIDMEDYNVVDDKELLLKRGDIFDKNDRILATSDDLSSIYANPNEIKDKQKASIVISNVLNIPKKEILQKLSSKKNFVWIKRQITPNQESVLKNEKIPGLYFKDEYKRFYPNKNLASHIIGFCNIDNKGVEGIERGFEEYLTGAKEKNNAEYLDSDYDNGGYNLQLTIDSFIQTVAEDSLKNSVLKEGAESGTLILLDGLTGEILTLANYPDYDPNFYSTYDQKYFRNSAVFNQFEPGSVFKVFVMALLMDAKLLSKNDYFICKGQYEKDGVVVRDTGVHGPVNISGIFKYSCNVGTLEAASRIKKNEFYNYLKLFGFGEATGLGLPGEQTGLLRDVQNWSNRSMLAIPIGQEISVNALQMVKAATVFINDGIMVEPRIVSSVFDNDNRIIKKYEKKEVRRVIAKGISKEIIKAMESATDEIGGSARLLRIEGITFAAKSGTAEIYNASQKKYSNDRVTSSLLTIFPAENPRYVAYIVFHDVYHDKEGRVRWGGIIGSKLINDFVSRLTGYLDIETENKIKVKKSEF
ncbi:MAG TPA: penicillin-binding protein 2 [Spirochaetota bacterium]|nr:penicillin-binding protein 2 [Spirochaetota bacterium]